MTNRKSQLQIFLVMVYIYIRISLDDGFTFYHLLPIEENGTQYLSFFSKTWPEMCDAPIQSYAILFYYYYFSVFYSNNY